MQHWVEGTRATISRTYKLRNKNAIGGLSRWQWNHMGDHNYNLKYSLWSWEESMIFYELLWPNNVQINETVLFLERIGYQKDLKPFCINSNKRTPDWCFECSTSRYTPNLCKNIFYPSFEFFGPLTVCEKIMFRVKAESIFLSRPRWTCFLVIFCKWSELRKSYWHWLVF